MEDTAYKQWWPLHRRTVVGEPLSAEEQARYEAGLRQLVAEEPPIQSSINALRRVREQVEQAEAERLQVEALGLELEIAMSKRDNRAL